jgi:hypothetical protein
MSSFQNGFSMGAGIYQRSLDNKDREKRREAEDKERALRLEQVQLGIDTQRRAISRDGDRTAMLRDMRDFATGVDRAGTNAALDADFDQAMAASDSAVKAENVARAGGAAAPAGVAAQTVTPGAAPDPAAEAMPAAAAPVSAVPALRGGSNAANEAALTVRNAVDPASADYRQGMNRRMLDLALFDGNTQAAGTLQAEGRQLSEDDFFAQRLKEYKGGEDQIGATASWLNESSKRITMGTPDKNGLVRMSIVGPDKTAEFLKLSRGDQAKLYAAGHMLERNPTRALEIMAGVNKGLAEAVAADNNLSSALAGNTNDVAGKSATITASKNADARGTTAASDARTERERVQKEATDRANAAVALYQESTPGATPAQIEAVRRGVMPAPEKIESDFKPDAIGAGGTAVQRLLDGSMVTTRIDQNGQPAKKSTTIQSPRSRAAAPARSQPTPSHIKALTDNPARAAEFDAKFGPGAAARVLGAGGPSGS